MRAVAPHRAFYMRARVGEDAPQAFRMRAIAAVRAFHMRARVAMMHRKRSACGHALRRCRRERSA